MYLYSIQSKGGLLDKVQHRDGRAHAHRLLYLQDYNANFLHERDHSS